MLKETVWNKIFNLIIKKIFYCTWNSRWGFDLLKVQCKVRDVRIFYLQCMLVLCLYIAPFLQSSDIIVHRHNVHCTPAQCTLSIVIFSSVQKTNLCTKKSILEIPVCSLRYFCILSSHSQNKLKENFTKWKKKPKMCGRERGETDYYRLWRFFRWGGREESATLSKDRKDKKYIFLTKEN